MTRKTRRRDTISYEEKLVEFPRVTLVGIFYSSNIGGVVRSARETATDRINHQTVFYDSTLRQSELLSRYSCDALPKFRSEGEKYGNTDQVLISTLRATTSGIETNRVDVPNSITVSVPVTVV